jgi:hypothetical protein
MSQLLGPLFMGFSQKGKQEIQFPIEVPYLVIILPMNHPLSSSNTVRGKYHTWVNNYLCTIAER